MKPYFGPFASHQATLLDLLIIVQVKFGPASVKKKLYLGPISSSQRKFGPSDIYQNTILELSFFYYLGLD